MRGILSTILGFIMVLCPLALWVAWTVELFYGVLLVFGLAFCFLLLIERTPEMGDRRR